MGTAAVLSSSTRMRHVFAAALAIIAVLAFFVVGGSEPSGATRRSITLTDASKGHLYYLYPGDKITVVLHSTYWSITPLTGPKIVAQVGAVHTAPLPPGASGCVAGQGCGTVTVHYVATSLGAVRLSATRTSCGEALRCSPANGRWSVIVKVY